MKLKNGREKLREFYRTMENPTGTPIPRSFNLDFVSSARTIIIDSAINAGILCHVGPVSYGYINSLLPQHGEWGLALLWY